MSKQEQRQAINSVKLVGEVKEHKLKLNKGKNDKGESFNYINGSLVIKTGEFSEIEIGIYVTEKTKEDKTKKVFETLNAFIEEELLTLAGCKSAEDRDYVAKVRVFGNGDFQPHFKEDIFKIESGEVKTKIKMDLGFGTISVDNSITEEDYKAEFEVEMYVSSVKEEEKDGEETGRVLITGWTPVYGGKVIPMEVIAGTILDDDDSELDLAEDFRSQVEEGMTVNFWGEINYKTIITKTTKGGGIGKAKVEEKKTYINELLLTGADIQEDEEKEFDAELIKKAKINRDNDIEEKKNAKDSGESKGKGINKGSSSADKPKRDRPKF